MRRLFFSRNSSIGLKTILLKILLNTGNNKKNCAIIFQKLLATFFVDSYNIKLFPETFPLCKQFLKIIDRGFTAEESHIFNNLIDISS